MVKELVGSRKERYSGRMQLSFRHHHINIMRREAVERSTKAYASSCVNAAGLLSNDKALLGNPLWLARGLVKLVTAVAYHFCLNLPGTFSQPRASHKGMPSTIPLFIAKILLSLQYYKSGIPIHCSDKIPSSFASSRIPRFNSRRQVLG